MAGLRQDREKYLPKCSGRDISQIFPGKIRFSGNGIRERRPLFQIQTKIADYSDFFQDLVNIFTRVQNTMSRLEIDQTRDEDGHQIPESGRPKSGHQIPEFTRWGHQLEKLCF